MLQIPDDRTDFILFLYKIGEARFESLLGILNIPTEYLPGKSAEFTIRVSGLIGLAEAPGGCGLERIRQALAKILQTNPLETHSANEEALAEELLAQYRKKLENAIGTARFYGLPDRPLEKVFVELTVIEDFEIPRDAEYKALMDKELRRRRTLFPKDETEEDEENDPEESDEEERKQPRKVRRTVKPEELLEAGKRSQVVGAPGCGKTTLLRWLALQTAKTSDRLPVFIELKALKKAQLETIDEDFSVFLFQQGVKRRFDRTDLTVKQFSALETGFYEYYKAGRLVVLLDGLDEIAEGERHRLRTAVESYSNHHEGGLTLIVSTRPYGYLRNFADLKAMEIEPLSDVQIGQFLDHWFEKPTAETVKGNLRKNPNLRSLARSPFLLAFIAHLNSTRDVPRIELYQKIISELIVKLDKDKGVERFKIDDPSGVLKHKFLKQFAYSQLFENQQVEISTRLVFHTEDLFNAAKAFLKKEEEPTISPRNLVHDVCATPLLREVEGGRYTFAHLTIQEFLAAEKLSKRDDCHELFIKAFFNRQLAEMEVLPMAISLADNPNELYKLLSKTPESFDFIRLCLEGRSLRYNAQTLLETIYQTFRKKLTEFGLGKIHCELVFGDIALASFTENEATHSKNLICDFILGLSDQNEYIRHCSADSLGRLGNASPDVVLALSKTLRDKHWTVRRSAAEALGKLGNASPEVISGLISVMHDQTPNVCRSAVFALGQLGNASPNVLQALSDALRNENWILRLSAPDALGQLGNASPNVIRALTDALRDKSDGVRKRAAEALGKLGNTSPDVISSLSQTLCDEYETVRRSAADALGTLGNASPEVIQALAKVLRDQNRYVRLCAADALRKLGNASPDVIQTLAEALRDEDGYVRLCAADALGTLGNASPDVIQALAEALRDKDRYVRQNAAEALGKLGNRSFQAIQALSKGIRDKKSDVRQSAAEALGKRGDKSSEVISILSKGLRDKESDVRKGSAEALGRLGNASPDIIHALTKRLNDKEWDVRRSSAEALGKLGNASPNVIRALFKKLYDQNQDVRQSSYDAFVQLGNTPPDIIRAISDELFRGNFDVRHWAAYTLGKLCIPSPDIIRALSTALREGYLFQPQFAFEALAKLGGVNSPDFIQALSEALNHRDSDVCKWAAEALGKLSNPSPGVICKLCNALLDRDWRVCQRAAEALERIGFDSPVFREGLKLLLSDPDPELQKMALRSIGYPSTDPGLLDDLKKLTEPGNPEEIREAAEDAYNKYKFKLEMLGLLPA